MTPKEIIQLPLEDFKKVVLELVDPIADLLVNKIEVMTCNFTNEEFCESSLCKALEKIKFVKPSWSPPHYFPREGFWDECAQPMDYVPAHVHPLNFPFWYHALL